MHCLVCAGWCELVGVRWSAGGLVGGRGRADGRAGRAGVQAKNKTPHNDVGKKPFLHDLVDRDRVERGLVAIGPELESWTSERGRPWSREPPTSLPGCYLKRPRLPRSRPRHEAHVALCQNHALGHGSSPDRSMEGIGLQANRKNPGPLVLKHSLEVL